MSASETRSVDVFCASINRAIKLRGMIESVRATGYAARVYVGAGGSGNRPVCETMGDGVECAYRTEANQRLGRGNGDEETFTGVDDIADRGSEADAIPAIGELLVWA